MDLMYMMMTIFNFHFMSPLELLRINSHTAIWRPLSVRAQELSACDALGIHAYGCVLPTSCIIHQLDDKRPAGDDSSSSRKEVSVAEEEAIWRRRQMDTRNFLVLSGKLASFVWSVYTQ